MGEVTDDLTVQNRDFCWGLLEKYGEKELPPLKIILKSMVKETPPEDIGIKDLIYSMNKEEVGDACIYLTHYDLIYRKEILAKDV